MTYEDPCHTKQSEYKRYEIEHIRRQHILSSIWQQAGKFYKTLLKEAVDRTLSWSPSYYLRAMSCHLCPSVYSFRTCDTRPHTVPRTRQAERYRPTWTKACHYPVDEPTQRLNISNISKRSSLAGDVDNGELGWRAHGKSTVEGEFLLAGSKISVV